LGQLNVNLLTPSLQSSFPRSKMQQQIVKKKKKKKLKKKIAENSKVRKKEKCLGMHSQK